MDGVLSQEEISALLAKDQGSADKSTDSGTEILSDSDKDAIGEVANISMGTAATTLSSLVNRKVEISTPVVDMAEWEDVVAAYERPCVFIRIAYTVGLDGTNLLVLKENDVKVITDLMMGGDGTNTDAELGELHLSAISEAMNQMMGSSATSLSSMLSKTIDISPPVADLIDLQDTEDEGAIEKFLTGEFVKISFKMEISDLVDSEIMQLYPVSFAQEMCASITQSMGPETSTESNAAPAPETAPASQPAPQPMMAQPTTGMGQQMMNQQPMMAQPMMAQPVNVQQAQFQSFTNELNPAFQSENIDLIMDVPLEVTVELGRTSKSIQDILDFAPGTIIELNKIAGEPIDVLVNGKYVAKGEVVVIEESYGIRITDIVK